MKCIFKLDKVLLTPRTGTLILQIFGKTRLNEIEGLAHEFHNASELFGIAALGECAMGSAQDVRNMEKCKTVVLLCCTLAIFWIR